MSASFHSPIGRASPAEGADSPREAADHERAEREHDVWALAIAQAVVEARPRLTLPLAPEPDETAPARNESVKMPTLGHADAATRQRGARPQRSAARGRRCPRA
jgi:hypothetical protein